jgi:hypothetical protein
MTVFKGTDYPELDNPGIPEEENRILEKLAVRVVRWRMGVPAILFLESVKPLNYIGSQMMVFFEPMVQTIFNFKDYDIFRVAMERRENVEHLLLKIEKYDAVMYEWERKLKIFTKAEKKKWKWHQRYLAIRRPKIDYPEELRKFPLPDIDKRILF